MSIVNENKSGYKETKVGWIPDDWKLIPIENHIKLSIGQVSPLDEPYIDYIHIGPDNIGSGTGKLANLKTAREIGLSSGKYLFDKHALVYSKIRPNLNKVCYPQFKGICSADAYPI